jgi:hypothetical protein
LPDPDKKETFPIVFTQRRVLPLAVILGAAGATLGGELWMRIACGVLALGAAAVGFWQHRSRPALVVDDQGYSVMENGREKLRVLWSEVVRVRADAAEFACYVDCGDPARNLLVPPARGFGFRFERSRELYARIVDTVTDKVELVPRLDVPPEPKKT